MFILGVVIGVVGGLFIPSPVSASGRALIKKFWNKIFKKNADDVAV